MPAADPSQSRRHDVRLLPFLVLFAPPVIILADTGIALLRGWKLEQPVTAVFTAGAVAWIAGLAGALLIAPMRGRVMAMAPKAAMWVASLVIAVGVLEAAMRMRLLSQITPDHPFHLMRANYRGTTDPDPAIMAGVSGTAHINANSWGVRGSDPPGREEAYRVLCIGGSATLCLYLDQSETWADVFMRNVNAARPDRPIWTGNAGKSGANSRHHLAFMRNTDLVEQVDCVILMLGVNDLMHMLEKYPSLAGETENAELVLKENDPLRPLWRQSVLLTQVGRVSKRLLRGGTDVEDRRGVNLLERRELRRKGVIVDELPDYARELERYARDIRRMVYHCRSKGTRIIFLTEPAMWRADLSERHQQLLWFGERWDHKFTSVRCLREALDRYNEVLMRTAAEAGAECLDLSQMNGQERWYLDDCHFNEAGAREVARRLADRFLATPAP